MSVTAVDPAPAGGVLSRWRNHPKFELWLAFWTMIVFYNFFFILFFAYTRVQPPPEPAWAIPRVLDWFASHRFNLLSGFAIVFLVTGLTACDPPFTPPGPDPEPPHPNLDQFAAHPDTVPPPPPPSFGTRNN